MCLNALNRHLMNDNGLRRSACKDLEIKVPLTHGIPRKGLVASGSHAHGLRLQAIGPDHGLLVCFYGKVSKTKACLMHNPIDRAEKGRLHPIPQFGTAERKVN